jgi:FkbM family methyltransferase
MFPNATFHCFEPIDYNSEEIRQNVDFYGVGDRVNVHKVALSDINGIAKMYVSSGQSPRVTMWNTGNKSSSLFKPTGHIKEHPWCNFTKRAVKTARLDDLFSGTTFHFVHMDVQGAEMTVLQGGEQVFRNTVAFWVEVAKKELYAGQPLKDDIVEYMKKIGCRCTLDACVKDYGDMFFERIL